MKWKTLQHNGILFPPKYRTWGIGVKIRGKKLKLNAIHEEMIYQWAKKKDTPYAQDATFQKNFTADLAVALGPEFKGITYGDIDFTEAYRLADREKDRREMMTKEERKELAAKRKVIREEMKAKFGKAILDGQEVEVANYMAEPPGIFIGRGEHPLRGKWKRRVTHADVTLNIGKGAKVPPGNWGRIVREADSMWLASWMDELTQRRKYVWLADTAGLKQERDRAKYDKAVNLASKIKKIEASMVRDMKSRDPVKARIATACYLIYKTAMRVGDEKDADEADTVGATTLRKEHIKITEKAIEFDFLGKDSVRWQESVPASEYDGRLQKNLKKLMQGKRPGDEIFHGITSRHANRYYSSIVAGLTAKVFRTYLASKVVTGYLREHADVKSASPNKKIYHAKRANLEAAIMCNHKRTIPKTFEASLQKKRETLKKAIASVPKTEKQKERKKERIERIRLQIDLAERTKDYNIGTSLRNYIDPRVFRAWMRDMDAEWEKLYTAALQRKFLWVKGERARWKAVSRRY